MTHSTASARTRLLSTTAGRLSVLTASSALVALSALPAAATPPADGGNGADKVTLCHATGSASNPYVQITVAAAGAYNGHFSQHEDLGAGDIIPPFQFQGQTYSLNWDAEGQATFAAGCQTPTKPGNPGTPDNPGTPGTPGNPGNPGTPMTPGTPVVPVGSESSPAAPKAPEATRHQPPTASEVETSAAGPIPKAADAGRGPVSSWQLAAGLGLAGLGAVTGGLALYRRSVSDS